MAKDKVYRRLIHSVRWRNLRAEVLTHQPLCERCLKEKRLRSATEVHHIRPVEEAVSLEEKERLMFDARNLMALCHECHVKTHTEMGRSGRKARTERVKKQVESIIKRFF